MGRFGTAGLDVVEDAGQGCAVELNGCRRQKVPTIAMARYRLGLPAMTAGGSRSSETGKGSSTRFVALAVLLARFGSGPVAVTYGIADGAGGFSVSTGTVMVAVPPGGMVPRSQVTGSRLRCSPRMVVVTGDVQVPCPELTIARLEGS